MIEKITGKTVMGKGFGRKLGFPTLNIPYKGLLSGVYAGRVFVNGKFEKAAIHVGRKPTFSDEPVMCESYLVVFDGNVDVGTEIKVELLEKVRNSRKFDNEDDLKKQISDDVEFVKGWYNSQG
ncbi:MAG: riboflavin kinase [Candidatus Peregrinibacteria bacterium]